MDLSIRQLKEGFGMRPRREEDAEAVVTLLRACDVAIFGEPERVGMRVDSRHDLMRRRIEA